MVRVYLKISLLKMSPKLLSRLSRSLKSTLPFAGVPNLILLELSPVVFLAPEKTRVQYDDLDLRHATVRPHICFKGLWKQGGQWGLQFEVLNLLVQPASDAPIPF